jgi:ABC-type lipoprotein export system ATPase subunit
MVTHDHGLAQRAKRQILIKDGRVSELTTTMPEPLQHEPLHIVSPAAASNGAKVVGV